jgi:hypothetical protein
VLFIWSVFYEIAYFYRSRFLRLVGIPQPCFQPNKKNYRKKNHNENNHDKNSGKNNDAKRAAKFFAERRSARAAATNATAACSTATPCAAKFFGKFAV